MVHALNALRKKKGLLQDTCEIFVKEPLLDWIKDAKQKNRGRISNEPGYGKKDSLLSMGTSEGLNEGLSWYPRKKIEIVRKKLLGVNPVKILHRELKDSQHANKPYMAAIERAI